MRNNPSIPWSSVGWTASLGGNLACGDKICMRNTRNGATATAYVVDRGGKGSPVSFDLDYARVFSVMDPDYRDYLAGKMNIEWWKC